MDALNNVNTVISIVVGLFGIGGYIVGITAYVRHKAASSQQQQVTQLVSFQKQPAHQIMLKRMSMLDWLEAFLFGIGDCLKAWGIWVSIPVGVVGAVIFGTISAELNNFILIILYSVFYLTLNLLFYVYFVGRRIETKTEEINKPLMPMPMQQRPRTSTTRRNTR
jgi:ABC-type branched-subunit amino acid transport system permease subunit